MLCGTCAERTSASCPTEEEKSGQGKKKTGEMKEAFSAAFLLYGSYFKEKMQFKNQAFDPIMTLSFVN